MEPIKTDNSASTRDTSDSYGNGQTDFLREKILSKLRGREMSITDLAASLDVTEQEVLYCLTSLDEDGITGSKPDPASSCKVYYIKSGYGEGFSRKDRMEIDLKEYISRYISKSGDPLEFFGLILRTLRVALINEGIDVDPVLHEAGVDMGEVLYQEIKGQDLETLLGNIAAFWEAHKLGRIKIESYEPLTIVVYECFECGDLPYLGRPACSFDSGILEALFSAHFNVAYSAIETHCYALGDEYCRFVVIKQTHPCASGGFNYRTASYLGKY